MSLPHFSQAVVSARSLALAREALLNSVANRRLLIDALSRKVSQQADCIRAVGLLVNFQKDFNFWCARTQRDVITAVERVETRVLAVVAKVRRPGFLHKVFTLSAEANADAKGVLDDAKFSTDLSAKIQEASADLARTARQARARREEARSSDLGRVSAVLASARAALQREKPVVTADEEWRRAVVDWAAAEEAECAIYSTQG
eukprot:Hpha_TRINITY_DN16451_c2_g2::TRINITY_DN16451_c2_g2_i2::g.163157::m.163157